MKKKIFGQSLSRLQTAAIPTGIAALFVFLAGKIALSRQFLPYDEPFHFGIIKIYAHHLSPFLGAQPQSSAAYGAVANDPSYLYHYLMSFPYRLITLFIPDQMGQLIALRFLNIGLALGTLYLVYRLARRCGLPTIGAQLVALALAVTPVFYDLAAQVNYDNLMIPLVLLTTLLTIDVAKKFSAKQVPVQKLAVLTSLILLASLVKYAYLPIGLAMGLYLIVVAVHNFGIRRFAASLKQTAKALSPVRQLLLVTLVLVSGGLWLQRDGMNIVQYHTPHPQCNSVLSVSACSEYGPWLRNYQLHQTRADRPQDTRQLAMFSAHWLHVMYTEVYGIVYAKANFVSYTPARTLRLLATVMVVGGLAAAAFAYKLFIRQRQVLVLGTVVAGVYLLTLWGQNFSDFHNLHAFIAVQGRYLLPVVPLLYIGVAIGYQAAFERISSFELDRLQALVSTLLVISWLGLRAMRRLGHTVVYGMVSATVQATRKPTLYARDMVLLRPHGT